MSKIITCEQVSNGHPDKICDQIADAIVTDILQHDRNARVAIECLLKKSQLFIAGEVTTDYRPNYNQIVHDVFNRIGTEKLGWNLTELLRIGILVDKQSPDIAMGVDKGGAGDQGIMYGYATNETAEQENVFKQLRLNMWVSSLTRFIPEHIYDLGNQPIDMEALKGRDCYGGLDLSSTGDITAFVLMFPPRVPEEKYIMLPFFWIPEDTIPQRVRRASVPYDVWYQQGYLMATEGNVIHYGFIEKVIEELGKTYHILEIAFDRWGAVQMTQNLEGMGFTVVPFGQGFKDMSPPTKEFYKLLMEGRITHGGNPVMAWMAGNVVVDTDPAGNIKPTKAKSPEKIDGIVAAIMALDRCIRNEGQQQGSVYDERDMIVF